MNEIPMLFGPESSLVGVVCRPVTPTETDVACLMFNAGVVPRIGPHRLNVKLARALGNAGMVSMRFDLSGLGDSRPANAPRDFLQQAILDLRAAMDYLEGHYGIRRFIVIGNCSGAVHAYWTALADQRVIGIQMFDGFFYRTRWSRLVRHWKRFHAVSWHEAAAALGRWLASPLSFLISNRGSKGSKIFSGEKTNGNPPRGEYCKGMQTLVDRGVAVSLVFSGSIIDAYSYAHQFRDAFGDQPFVDKVRCDFLPEIDHTLLSLQAQRQFIELILAWVQGIDTYRSGRILKMQSIDLDSAANLAPALEPFDSRQPSARVTGVLNRKIRGVPGNEKE